MKKNTYLIFGLIFLMLAVLSGVYAVFYPLAIVLTAVSVPLCLLCFVYWWCAGTKDGDIPFVGY